MAKIVLGSAPKSFKHKVSFPLLDGGKGDITMDYRYRNRAQFAEFIAGIFPDMKNDSQEPTGDGVDVVSIARETLEREVNYILAAASGWDLAEDFDAHNVKQLVNDFPGAANAIMAAYRVAVTEGKTKN